VANDLPPIAKPQAPHTDVHDDASPGLVSKLEGLKDRIAEFRRGLDTRDDDDEAGTPPDADLALRPRGPR